MIDPNAWVSAVINPYGTPARVAEAVARNVISAVIAPIRDPNDAYLVALAQATGSLLVSGDEDLLAGHLDPPAISPAQLLDLLAVDGPVHS